MKNQESQELRKIFGFHLGCIGGITMIEERYEDPLEIDLGEIEGKDPARARFIKGYLKAAI